MVDTQWIAWRDAWWGGQHVGRQQCGVEGGGGGRAAHNGAVAHDGAEGKRRGGAACEGAGGKGGGGHTRRGRRPVDVSGDAWVRAGGAWAREKAG